MAKLVPTGLNLTHSMRQIHRSDLVCQRQANLQGLMPLRIPYWEGYYNPIRRIARGPQPRAIRIFFLVDQAGLRSYPAHRPHGVLYSAARTLFTKSAARGLGPRAADGLCHIFHPVWVSKGTMFLWQGAPGAEPPGVPPRLSRTAAWRSFRRPCSLRYTTARRYRHPQQLPRWLP